MNEEIYLHTLYTSKIYSLKKSLELLEKILKSNAVLSRKQQGSRGIINFSGDDYISLVDFQKRNITKEDEYNSYHLFSRFYPSLIFPKKDIEVINPIILEEKIFEYSGWITLMNELGNDKENRYTDLPDEVQVKDRISLDLMSGFMMSSYEAMNFWKNDSVNADLIKKELEKYKELLIKYGYDIPIYDSITFEPLDNNDNINDTVKKLRLFNKGKFLK